MLKKVIPMFLALCMIIGSTAAFGTGYEVSDGFTAASADAEQGPASSVSSDTNMNSPIWYTASPSKICC